MSSSNFQPSRSVFHPAVDSILRLRRGDRQETMRRVRRAIERFPAIAEADRASLLRHIALHDAANRLVFRAHNAFPRAAQMLARLVPVVGATQLVAGMPPDRPLIFGLLHFGPTHFAITVATRLFPKRSVYVFHAGGETGRASARYLSAIGTIPVLTGRAALPKVRAAMLERPGCVVILCYDHLGVPGRRTVPFLGARIAVPTGLAHLVNATDASAIVAWWEWTRFGPRLRVGEALEIDRGLAGPAIEDDLTDRSIRALEARVLAAPAAWTEWANCGDDGLEKTTAV